MKDVMRDQTALMKMVMAFRMNALAKPVIQEWVIVLAAYSFVRIFLSLLAALVVWNGEPASPWAGDFIFETRAITMPDQGRLAQVLINPWYRWDTGWYLKIAAFGYSATDGSIAFPPLYPLLIRLLAPIFQWNYLLAALVITNISCIAALYLFRAHVFQELRSEEKTNRAFIFLLAFPTAFYLFSAYTEAPFFAATLGAWLLARREKWLWAGVLAAIASLTRLQGSLLVIPFAWMLFSAENTRETFSPLAEVGAIIKSVFQKQAWSSFFYRFKAGGWTALLMPVVAIVGYQGWLSSMGLGKIDVSFQNLWHISILPPWESLAAIIGRLFSDHLSLVDWVDFSLFSIAILSGLIGLFKLKVSLSLYLWSTIGFILMRGNTIQLMTSFSRYVLVLFPLFLILAGIKNSVLRNTLIFVSAVLNLLLAWLFLNWSWVA